MLARALTSEFFESGCAAWLLMAMPVTLPKRWTAALSVASCPPGFCASPAGYFLASTRAAVPFRVSTIHRATSLPSTR